MVPIKTNFVDPSKYGIKCPYTRTPTRSISARDQLPPVTGQIKDKKRYTIVEEKTGTGSAKGWGRLKAGGWVARDWIKKA